jgi:hypothetical protein
MKGTHAEPIVKKNLEIHLIGKRFSPHENVWGWSKPI